MVWLVVVREPNRGQGVRRRMAVRLRATTRKRRRRSIGRLRLRGWRLRTLVKGLIFSVLWLAMWVGERGFIKVEVEV